MTPPTEGGAKVWGSDGQYHKVIVWGPAVGGEQLVYGKTVHTPGWVWTCSCETSVIGYDSESEANEGAEDHIDDVTFLLADVKW